MKEFKESLFSLEKTHMHPPNFTQWEGLYASESVTGCTMVNIGVFDSLNLCFHYMVYSTAELVLV